MSDTKDEINADKIHFQKLQDDSEYREKILTEYIRDLTAEGAEYFPFSHANVCEALANIGDASMRVMSSYIYTAQNLPDNEFAQQSCAQTVVLLIRNYWEAVARKEAENIIAGMVK